LRDRVILGQRQDSLRQLLDNGGYDYLRGLLRGTGDVERILARVALKSARPRDLIAWPMRSPDCPACNSFSAC
jgi:DNA mismatch repair protein MutS